MFMATCGLWERIEGMLHKVRNEVCNLEFFKGEMMWRLRLEAGKGKKIQEQGLF